MAWETRSNTKPARRPCQLLPGLTWVGGSGAFRGRGGGISTSFGQTIIKKLIAEIAEPASGGRHKADPVRRLKARPAGPGPRRNGRRSCCRRDSSATRFRHKVCTFLVPE